MNDYRPSQLTTPSMTLREIAEGTVAMLSLAGIVYLIISFI
jgi:hypothetical protein